MFGKHHRRHERHERYMRHARGFGRPHGMHRHGRRAGRLLEHGDLRFVVLTLLAEQPRHGYELMRELEDRTGGAYRPSPGVVYPTLAMLEDEGYARAVAEDGGRKQYEATGAGRAALAENRAQVDAMFQRLDEAAAQSALNSPKVLRAMENLRTAVRLRLSHGPLSPPQIDAVAAILDRAAGEVEGI